MRRIILWVGGTLVVLALVATAAWFGRHELGRINAGLPAFTHPAGAESLVRVAMPDGIELATTIHRPAGDGPWPTVLIRNPYQGFDLFVRDWCRRLVRYGYACVYQDTRGQGGSDGEWQPLVNEPVDGSATLHWLADQDFQDGNIGMIGPSYLGGVQWAAAADLPPEVKTLVPAIFSTDTHGVLYQNGMFRHETFTAWAAQMRSPDMNADGSGAAYQASLRHRPHLEADEAVFGERLPWYREWISSPSPSDELWQRTDNIRLQTAPQRLQIPILMIGGWYDVFIGPQMNDWQRLASRDRSRFIIGPWTHVGGGSDAFPTLDEEDTLFQWPAILDWLGHQLKGEPLEAALGVYSFGMREGRWRSRAEWPPATTPQRFHFGAASAAHDCSGGTLNRTPPEAADVGRYAYDPDNPVPTRGGAGMLAFVLPGFEGAPPGTQWQKGLCERGDVLTFTSEPLTEELRIAGEIEIALTIESDAEDTAFTARVIEVMDDGRAINVRDGITSLAYRNGAQSPLSYAPGSEETVRLRLWPIEWRLRPRSRLRVDISSSDFPKYHAHTNHAGPWAEQATAKIANQRIHIGGDHAGFVELPITTDP